MDGSNDSIHGSQTRPAAIAIFLVPKTESLKIRPVSNGLWESAPCLCGQVAGTIVLEVPHPDAPNGIAWVRRCQNCGLRRLDPRPSLKTIGRYYPTSYNAFAGRNRGPNKQRAWDLIRDIGSKAPVRPKFLDWVHPVASPLARWLFDIHIPLDTDPMPRVLEVGSGYGDLLIYLAARGCDVRGIDPDPRAAESCGRSGIRIRTGQLPCPDLPDGSFDVAVLCHSLEHIHDPNAALIELRRLLRDGGTLHLAVPNGNAAALEHEGRAWAHLSFPLHLWFFDRDTLTRLLAAAGFQKLVYVHTTSRHHYWTRWIADRHQLGTVAATRRLLAILQAHRQSEDGGDVLRIVAGATSSVIIR